MSQHDPSAPGQRYSQGRPPGAHQRTTHGETAAWSSEVPEPASIPTDWSPSGAYAGHHSAGYHGDPGGAPAAWLSTPTEPGGAPVAWDQPSGSVPGWSGRHPEPDPAASWNGNTTMSSHGYRTDPEPTVWNGGHVDPEPARRSTGYTDVEPTAWNGSSVPDRIPAEWNTPSTSWHTSAATSAAPTSPPTAAWHASPAPVDHSAALPRTEEKGVAPDRTAGRARKSPKLMMAAALTAAALAGGGVGAGLMAAFGEDRAATAPAGPGAGQMPGGQPPDGQAPDAAPSQAAD
ncbi:hypothetical protein Q0Z83_083630 [Actinoplanes sichuanensis]|uniref:Uncharacterized protein n=1 Tax=Actinoplanes sichuanensis TaxID=512349 RepID=A0ABW4AUY9_9ACTN|nr:hypothetical protein [Actinoplanes sichuanensis]BEL10172.1 hypothetical protein Q0Z83_083630 [Actinoplanes sichuanensis]